MTNPIDALIAEKGILLADGATGTNLFNMGLASGEAPELWNEDAPEKIAALHRNFVEAGADIILTNSFGGTRHRLKLHGAEGRVWELNRLAAELARRVADTAGRRVIVAGSIGPTGELLEPLGVARRITAPGAEAYAPLAAFGPQGEIGVLFTGRSGSAQPQALFTSISCDPGADISLPR